MIQTKVFNFYKFILLSVTLAMLAATAIGQTTQVGALKGQVTDENKSVIPEAKLRLANDVGGTRETVSGLNGEFVFDDLAAGKYTLTVSKEGFADKITEINFDGTESNSQMTLSTGAVSESVTIVLDSSEAAVESTMKLPVSIHETPRSLSVIGSQRILEQNFRQVPDVLNYTPGTTQNSYRNGSYHFYSRGYRMGPEDTRVDGFSGVNVGSGGFGASTFGIEEIVVLRGPAGLVYGQSGSPGGLINMVSKRPVEKRFTRIDLRAGGYSGNGVSFSERPMFGIDFDSSGAVTGNERILYRAIATVENMNYFTRDTEDRNRYVNGSLTFKLDRNGQYQLTPSFQFTRYNRPYGGGVVISPSSSLSANDGLSTINVDDLSPLDVNLFSGRRIEETGWAGLDFRGVVNERIRVNAAYRYISFDTDINSFTPQATSAAPITRLRNEGVVSRVQAKSLTERNYNNFNADVSYEWLATPRFRNTTQVGFYSRRLDSRTTTPLGTVPGAQSPINVYTGIVLSPLVDNFPEIQFGDWGGDTVWNGFVQNRTSLFSGRLHVMIGFNYGENDPVTGAVRKSGLVPNASVVFNATPELAVYASYSTSFNPVDPNLEDASGNIGTFDPTIGKNYEAGFKYDLLDRRLGLTFAVFQNQIDNALVQTDLGVVNPNNFRYFVPAGTRRARGAEMTGEFRIRQDLIVSGGASYTEAVYLGFPEGLTASGRPPANAPIPYSWAEKTPRWSYNVYTRYDRREGYLKGFGAGLGIIWQGSRIGSNGARTYGSPDPLVLPAFTRVDSAVYYRLNKHINFALNVDNVFDEVIFVNASVGSNIEIAAPRTATLRTSFNF